VRITSRGVDAYRTIVVWVKDFVDEG